MINFTIFTSWNIFDLNVWNMIFNWGCVCWRPFIPVLIVTCVLVMMSIRVTARASIFSFVCMQLFNNIPGMNCIPHATLFPTGHNYWIGSRGCRTSNNESGAEAASRLFLFVTCSDSLPFHCRSRLLFPVYMEHFISAVKVLKFVSIIYTLLKAIRNFTS